MIILQKMSVWNKQYRKTNVRTDHQFNLKLKRAGYYTKPKAGFKTDMPDYHWWQNAKKNEQMKIIKIDWNIIRI